MARLRRRWRGITTSFLVSAGIAIVVATSLATPVAISAMPLGAVQPDMAQPWQPDDPGVHGQLGGDLAPLTDQSLADDIGPATGISDGAMAVLVGGVVVVLFALVCSAALIQVRRNRNRADQIAAVTP